MTSLKIKNMLAVAMLAAGSSAMAQNLNSAYFTDQFASRNTMNPAFGNDQNFVSIPGLGNVNISLQGNFGYEDVVMKNPRFGIDSNKKMTTFMNPYISDAKALDGFSTSNNRVVGDVSVALLAAGFKAFGGYNTVELNSKSSLGMVLPYELFEFARNTGNNNYNISGDAQADVSMKGFQYKMKEKEYETAGAGTYEKIDDIDVDGAGLGGFGMALDLGAVYNINEDWTVSASVLDLGFMSWSNDMQATNKNKSFEFSGFHDTSVNSDRPGTIDDQTDKYSDQITDFINLQDKGDKGSRTTGLGSTLNVGCEYQLPAYRKISFGLLSTTRIKGEYSWTEGRLSANWKPLKWLDGGISFAASSFATSMGYVVNIHPKGYNFFIGMDHILGKTSKECIPLSSNASISMGMSVTW